MKLALIASDSPEAQEAAAALRNAYDFVATDDADTVIALGGDGFMLQTLHHHWAQHIPIYGMNRGTVGFLLNDYRPDGLEARIKAAEHVTIRPLRMRALTCSGETIEHLAINEVSLLRETRQTAKIRISIDNKIRLEELVGDGVLLATPAGSTAYNLSAYGPIIPLSANLLALTPISAFRPRRWRGALLPNQVTVELEVLEAKKRPVLAVADMHEVRDVRRLTIAQDFSYQITLLFDPEHGLEERIFTEQFLA